MLRNFGFSWWMWEMRSSRQSLAPWNLNSRREGRTECKGGYWLSWLCQLRQDLQDVNLRRSFSRLVNAERVGAPGSSSIAWSQIVCWGSLCDSSSLNTFLCRWYLEGIPPIGSVGIVFGWKMTLPMKYSFVPLSQGMFLCRGTKIALFALLACSMTGSCVWSIQPRFQSIFGCAAVNHG